MIKFSKNPFMADLGKVPSIPLWLTLANFVDVNSFYSFPMASKCSHDYTMRIHPVLSCCSFPPTLFRCLFSQPISALQHFSNCFTLSLAFIIVRWQIQISIFHLEPYSFTQLSVPVMVTHWASPQPLFLADSWRAPLHVLCINDGRQKPCYSLMTIETYSWRFFLAPTGMSAIIIDDVNNKMTESSNILPDTVIHFCSFFTPVHRYEILYFAKIISPDVKCASHQQKSNFLAAPWTVVYIFIFCSIQKKLPVSESLISLDEEPYCKCQISSHYISITVLSHSLPVTPTLICIRYIWSCLLTGIT